MEAGKKDAKGNPVDKEKELFWKVNKEWRNLPEEKVQELWNQQMEARKPKKKGKGVKENGPLKT